MAALPAGSWAACLRPPENALAEKVGASHGLQGFWGQTVLETLVTRSWPCRPKAPRSSPQQARYVLPTSRHQEGHVGPQKGQE